jgi:hypothetical protein
MDPGALAKVGILCSVPLEEVRTMIASGGPVFCELAGPTRRRCSSISHGWPSRKMTANARRMGSNSREQTVCHWVSWPPSVYSDKHT